nr:hypothetical protein [Deltaproteobacteria bacterium]
MISILWAMIVTESRMQARQRLSALLVLVLPLLTMPGALMGGEIYLGTLERATSSGPGDHPVRLPVAVVGSDQVAGWIEASPGLRLTGAEESQVVARVDGHTVRLEFQSEVSESRAAMERAEDAIRSGVASRRAAALTAAGLPGHPED